MAQEQAVDRFITVKIINSERLQLHNRILRIRNDKAEMLFWHVRQLVESGPIFHSSKLLTPHERVKIFVTNKDDDAQGLNWERTRRCQMFHWWKEVPEWVSTIWFFVQTWKIKDRVEVRATDVFGAINGEIQRLRHDTGCRGQRVCVLTNRGKTWVFADQLKRVKFILETCMQDSVVMHS